MGQYTDTFDWIDFAESRVRYAGGQRGREEPAIETFAVDSHGQIWYGEIERIFLPDGNNYNLEVISFGWLKPNWIGAEPDHPSCATFTPEHLGDVQLLLCHAIRSWQKFSDRPPFLTEYSHAHFMGDLIFRNGWALIKDESIFNGPRI